ncbi:hypothetical protein EV702DRAFT_1097304 [Suillus placidus]|uniref:Uncharacterized protein n=1 Tax=Suillus placidus TaxID=48579 RepID=A0A9P6ZYH3_9AGAM|nr:hypothetical protein EV702DRAFT_1097304 [Suillus placidus]
MLGTTTTSPLRRSLQRSLQSCNPIAYALGFACTLGFSSYRIICFHLSRTAHCESKCINSLTGLHLALAFFFQVVLRLERIHHFQHHRTFSTPCLSITTLRDKNDGVRYCLVKLRHLLAHHASRSRMHITVNSGLVVSLSSPL